jgi:hypothetical protein
MDPYVLQTLVEARIADLHAEAALRGRARMARGSRASRAGISTRVAEARGATARWITRNASRAAVRQEPACCVA